MGRPVVTVKQGSLRGVTVRSVVGGSYISFKGVPYAAPPVEKLRFANPEPAISWTGIREAVEEGPKCAQYNPRLQKIVGGDDCLYLNVATTSLMGSRPVMVWIHGGAFLFGDGGSSIYSPDYLMKSDIVFVSMNYRLGVLGFLQLDHIEAAGNMGLKDQVAALKWVKENIAHFGGDPNNVTIFGESAGSASVHYLLLSPLAKGLFHKAILQSGVALNPWACTPMDIDTPHRLIAALGKKTTDPHKILEYLREVSAHRLVEVQEKIRSAKVTHDICECINEDELPNALGIHGFYPTKSDIMCFTFPFRPCIDVKSQQPFMPRSPRELATEGIDVPILIGYNSHEGALFAEGLSDELLFTIRENFDLTVTHELSDKTSPKIHEVGEEMRKFYFGDRPITMEALEEFVRCYGDLHFTMGIQKVLDHQLKNSSQTYFYKFIHQTPKSMHKIVHKSEIEGTAHADDLPYLFYQAFFGDHLKIDPNSIDQIVSDRFVKMWTNFAKTGNPTPEVDNLITVKWEPVTRATKTCLIINDELSVRENPDEDLFQLCQRVSAIIGSRE